MASAKWGEAPALAGQRDTPLVLGLSEGLGLNAHIARWNCFCPWAEAANVS